MLWYARRRARKGSRTQFYNYASGVGLWVGFRLNFGIALCVNEMHHISEIVFLKDVEPRTQFS